MRLQKSIEILLSKKAAHVQPNTIKQYTRTLHLWSEFMGSKQKISHIRETDLWEYQTYLREIYEPKTIQNCLTSLRMWILFWYRRGEIRVNSTDLKAPKAPEKVPVYVSYEMFKKMEMVLPDDEYKELRVKVMIHLLWNTGMRVSELLSMTLDHINTNESCTLIRTAKNLKMRYVAWDERCHKLLMRYIGIKLCKEDTNKLFSIGIRQVQRWIRIICKRAGITENVTPHSFRHGRAHYILDQGGRLIDIKNQLGHSSLEPPMKYLRLNKKEQIKNWEKFQVYE